MNQRLLLAKNQTEAFLYEVCHAALTTSKQKREAALFLSKDTRTAVKAKNERVFDDKVARANELREASIGSAKNRHDAICGPILEAHDKCVEVLTQILEQAKADALKALNKDRSANELLMLVYDVSTAEADVALADARDSEEGNKARAFRNETQARFSMESDRAFMSANDAYWAALAEAESTFERLVKPLREACATATREHDEAFDPINKPAQEAHTLALVTAAEEWRASDREADETYDRQYVEIRATYKAECRRHVEGLRTGRNQADEYFKSLSALALPEPIAAD